MKTAILTGFHAFGRYAVNPTEILARNLEGKILAGHQIHSLVFSTGVHSSATSSDYGEEIVAKALLVHASVILSLGIASEAKGVRIETKCVNWVENDTYCTVFENRRPVFSDCSPREKKSMPLQAWDLTELSRKFLAVGIPFEISEDAGSYCCNALMVRVLRALEDFSLHLPFLFAHVSCTEAAIAKIPDFDRKNKVILCQEDLPMIVEKLLESYCALTALAPRI